MADTYSLVDLEGEYFQRNGRTGRRRIYLWYAVWMVRSLLTVAVVAEGTFQQTVQGHQNDLVKHLDVSCAFCHQAVPLFLKDRKSAMFVFC